MEKDWRGVVTPDAPAACLTFAPPSRLMVAMSPLFLCLSLTLIVLTPVPSDALEKASPLSEGFALWDRKDYGTKLLQSANRQRVIASGAKQSLP